MLTWQTPHWQRTSDKLVQNQRRDAPGLEQILKIANVPLIVDRNLLLLDIIVFARTAHRRRFTKPFLARP